MRKGKKNHPLQFLVTTEQWKMLKKFAAEKDISIGHLVRLATFEYIDQQRKQESKT